MDKVRFQNKLKEKMQVYLMTLISCGVLLFCLVELWDFITNFTKWLVYIALMPKLMAASDTAIAGGLVQTIRMASGLIVVAVAALFCYLIEYWYSKYYFKNQILTPFFWITGVELILIGLARTGDAIASYSWIGLLPDSMTAGYFVITGACLVIGLALFIFMIIRAIAIKKAQPPKPHLP